MLAENRHNGRQPIMRRTFGNLPQLLRFGLPPEVIPYCASVGLDTRGISQCFEQRTIGESTPSPLFSSFELMTSSSPDYSQQVDCLNDVRPFDSMEIIVQKPKSADISRTRPSAS